MSTAQDVIPVSVTAERVATGGFRTAFLADAAATGGADALLEHTLAPALIGAAPHRHGREDELSDVLAGTLTVWRDGAAVDAGPGGVVRKPRGEWNTFWNAGTTPVRILELASPPALADYFRKLAEVIPARGAPDPAQLAALAALNFAALAPLVARHGLRLG